MNKLLEGCLKQVRLYLSLETQTLNTESSSSVDVETVKEDSVQKKEEGSKSTKESNSPEDAKPSETEEKKDAVSKTAVASKSTEDGNSSETVEKKDEAAKPTADTKSPSDKVQHTFENVPLMCL